MARKIVVTSGKGGVGKTTLVVYLAAWLAQKGSRVLIVDGDLGLNNLDVATGLENHVVYDVIDVIEGKCRAKQALVRHPKYVNLYLLTSNRSALDRYVSPQAFKLVLDGLSAQFDFIFIDCPAGIDEGFHRAVAAADEAILVTTPQLTALRDADRVITLLKSYRLDGLSLLVNRVRGERLITGACLSPAEIAGLLKLPLLGAVPEEISIAEGGMSKIHTAFRFAGQNLLTGKGKIYDVTKKYGGLWGSIRGALKRSL